MPPSAIVLHAVRPRRQHDFASGVAIAPSTPPLESFARSAPGQATSDVKLGVVSGPGSLFIALVETHCVWVSTSPKSSRACRTPRLTQTHQTFQFYCASKAARPLQTGHPFISPYERRNAREFSTAPRRECSRNFCGLSIGLGCSACIVRVVGVLFFSGAESGVRICFPTHGRFGMTPVYPRTDVGFPVFVLKRLCINTKPCFFILKLQREQPQHPQQPPMLHRVLSRSIFGNSHDRSLRSLMRPPVGELLEHI